MGFGIWNKGKARIGKLYLPASGLVIDGATVSATAAQLNTVSALAKPLNFKGVIDCSANPNYPAATAGDVYRVSVAGKIGGGAGPDVQANDSLICTTTAVAGTHAAVGASWYIEQGNIVSTADVPATTDKNYVTDADLVVLGNTSGTNTGDQVLPVKASGAEIDTGTDDAKFATAKAIADSKVTKGIATGYKIARSATPAAVTGTLDVDTGLTSVVSVSVTPSSDLDGDAFAGVSASIEGGAGHVLIKCWKVTTGGAAGNPTMIAATAAKDVHWIVIGT